MKISAFFRIQISNLDLSVRNHKSISNWKIDKHCDLNISNLFLDHKCGPIFLLFMDSLMVKMFFVWLPYKPGKYEIHSCVVCTLYSEPIVHIRAITSKQVKRRMYLPYPLARSHISSDRCSTRSLGRFTILCPVCTCIVFRQEIM